MTIHNMKSTMTAIDDKTKIGLTVTMKQYQP